MKAFKFLPIVFVCLSMCFGESKINKPSVSIFSGENTSVYLLQKKDNTYLLVGWGGAIGAHGACFMKSRGAINGKKLSGFLLGVNTAIVSYEVKDSTGYPFSAVLESEILDITEANVLDLCGGYWIFDRRYAKIIGEIELQKNIKVFIEVFEGAEGLDDLLLALKNVLSQNSILPPINSPGGKNPPQTNQPGIAQKSSFDALTAAHAKALTLYKNARKSEAAAVVVQFLKTNTIAEMVLTLESIGKYNDIGFFLEQGGEYTEAILVLKKVVELFPERTVAHLNIADAYKGLNQIDSAIAHYSKYSDLMKKDGKESKIPKRVLGFLAQNKK
jgi:tetratricopeptide (TPR) repeat protein